MAGFERQISVAPLIFDMDQNFVTFLHAHPALVGTLVARGYHNPTPVQAEVLQYAAAGADLLVSAQTGSGKTVAFGLAIAADLLGDAEALPRAGAPLALVVAPTRELAMQVHAELSWLYADIGGRVLACVGGMDPRREQRLLAGGAHIVVGTPGRLRDHINRRQLDPSALRAVVLDEADEMLDLGFREELEFILDAAPEKRRTLLFSATIPRDIVSMARRFQRDAVRLTIGTRDEPHKDITYTALCVAAGETTPAVINVLRHHEARLAIVFCPTRDAVRGMWTALNARGFLAVALSGEMAQGERNQALLALRAGRARVCVATDVAARGLDLPELSLVIHAELPMNAQLLLHRSGRTGRAGRKGASILLVQPSRRRRAEAMLHEAGLEANWESVPDSDMIRLRDQQRLLADPILTAPADEEEIAAAEILAAGHDAQSLGVALLRLYRSSLPEEESVTVMPTTPARGARPTREAAPHKTRDRGERVSGNRHEAAATVSDGVWLSVSVGRQQKADPKWLLPLLCRIGRVTRNEIGTICILPTETRFEVPSHVAGQFLKADENSVNADRGEPDDVRITSSQAPGASDRTSRPPRPHRHVRAASRPASGTPDQQARKPAYKSAHKPADKPAYKKQKSKKY